MGLGPTSTKATTWRAPAGMSFSFVFKYCSLFVGQSGIKMFGKDMAALIF
jgi:hypothetical protein